MPLLLVTALVAAGAGAMGMATGVIRRVERVVRIGAAVLLIVAGLHDTLVWAI